MVKEYLLLIWENRWQIVAVFIILRYGKWLFHNLVFVPLAGGNGKVQMDEMAKAIICVIFILSALWEGTRQHEWHIFSDAYWFALLGTICLIAGIKEGKHFFKPPTAKSNDEQKH